MDRKDLGKRYISTDRQTLLVNWTPTKSRKNSALHSIASADQATGYVYGAHLNFDSGMDEVDVARELPKFGDGKLAPPFRRFARVWLDTEYTQAATPHEPRCPRQKCPDSHESNDELKMVS